MSSPVPTAQRLDLEVLERLAATLVSQLGDDDEPEVLAVGITPVDDDLSVSIKPLEGADPIAGLLGFDAPEEWQAIGIVATGRWFALSDDEVERGVAARGPRQPGGRVRFAQFVTRTDDHVHVLCRDDEPPAVSRHEPEGQYGRADDVCRRALGRPTAPPRLDVRELWALVWCDVIIERVIAGAKPTWDEVASAHPAIGQLGPLDAEAAGWANDNLVRLGSEFAALHPWADLRDRCARSEWPITNIEPAEAAWMDDGMFSRWALEPYPELADLLTDLLILLPPDLAERVRMTAQAWGLR